MFRASSRAEVADQSAPSTLRLCGRTLHNVYLLSTEDHDWCPLTTEALGPRDRQVAALPPKPRGHHDSPGIC
jgi:hypothetical protein